jgi:hypothetical protein
MFIENQFNLGDAVYIKTDADQKKRMVIGILIRPSGILYELNCGDRSSYHYQMEISDTKDILLSTTN